MTFTWWIFPAALQAFVLIVAVIVCWFAAGSDEAVMAATAWTISGTLVCAMLAFGCYVFAR